jgi:hypothetical protein
VLQQIGLVQADIPSGGFIHWQMDERAGHAGE